MILYFCMFWLSIFYIADIYFNHGEHLETLSVTLAGSVIAIMVPYFIKSYLGKRNEENVRLQEKYLDQEENDENNSMEG